MIIYFQQWANVKKLKKGDSQYPFTLNIPNERKFFFQLLLLEKERTLTYVFDSMTFQFLAPLVSLNDEISTLGMPADS